MIMTTESERRRALLASIQAIKEQVELFDERPTVVDRAALLQRIAAFAALEDVRGDPVLAAMTEAFEILVRGRRQS